MLRAYVSSTFRDLEEHRRVAISTLERLGYLTRAMEKYFASDERPLDLCLADVARCDLYIGIFAWRYGTVPVSKNPDHRSITECELREAARLGIPCLIFLSDDQPDSLAPDSAADRRRIERLRQELRDGWTPAYFASPDNLGLEISVAVSGWRNKPDLSRYLTELASECSELPQLPIPNHAKNLSLGDIIRITVSFATKVPPSRATTIETEPHIVALPDAVASERAWLLVGDGGQGKSTALRFLTHHYARLWLDARQRRDSPVAEPSAPLIPIYLDLRADGTDLRGQVWAALQRPGFRCSAEDVDAWIAGQPLLFLVDRLEHTDPRVTINDLFALLRLAPNARLVVASRPLRALDESPWPQAHLQPPSDARMRSFFKRLLGPEQGGDLFSLLAQNGLLDPFRRPLFARLLALSSPELIARRQFTLGEMFRDVVEGRFLREWERSADSHVNAELMLDLLACLAYEMMVTRSDRIDRETALRRGVEVARRRGVAADVREAELLLDRALKHGLVSADDSGLQFWHASFRDYFAAVWLERYATAPAIYARTWDPLWHESLVFYFGLLRGKVLETRLRQLLIGLRVDIFLLSIGPSQRAASRLFLVLRCLVQAGDCQGLLRQRFVKRLPRSALFLSRHSARARYLFAYDPVVDPHRYFCDLIGQLRSPEAFAYLRSVAFTIDIVAPGLIRDPDTAGIERLVRFIAADDADDRDPGVAGYARSVVSHLLLRSTDAKCFASLKHVIRDSSGPTRQRVLASLSMALRLFQGEDESDVRDELADRWAPFLVDLVLNDEDRRSREDAVEFLNSLGVFVEDRGSLPLIAYRSFLDALSAPEQAVRARALGALRFPALKEHMDVAWRLLDESSVAMVCEALSHFCLSSSHERFCRAVLKVLRQHATEGSVLKTVAAEIHRRLCIDHPESRLPRRAVALLMSAALCGKYNGFQLYAVHAIGALRLGWTASFLTSVLWSDAWEETRHAAFAALLNLAGHDARLQVLRALEDESARLRFRAAAECYFDRLGDDFHPLAGPLLFRLLGDDSKDIRRYAELSLKRYGYLAEDWHSWNGTPVYVGPVAPLKNSAVG